MGNILRIKKRVKKIVSISISIYLSVYVYMECPRSHIHNVGNLKNRPGTHSPHFIAVAVIAGKLTKYVEIYASERERERAQD